MQAVFKICIFHKLFEDSLNIFYKYIKTNLIPFSMNFLKSILMYSIQKIYSQKTKTSPAIMSK